MESKFKKGQRVECKIFGWGEIVDATHDLKGYPILVSFDCGVSDEYTNDGKHSEEGNICLSPYGWNISEKEPVFKEGELVWVRNFENDEWHCRYYSHKQDKRHYYYLNQRKKGETYFCIDIKKFDDIPF